MFDFDLQIPFWVIALVVFLVPIRFLFEPKWPYSRAPIPKRGPFRSGGYTPDAKNHIENPAPPPKNHKSSGVDPVCTCPSGDGSLRWPCLKHLSAEFSDLPHKSL